MKNNTSNPSKILLIFTEVFLLLAGVTLKLFHIATAFADQIGRASCRERV